ncbi:erythromycin esterase family protein [Planotetraspora sp. GP83]|uniref:erythromycin esterase family protein n=1 Tax=Planotetraspora sp. GP83 TaxID=3156264 RepID=UPI003519A5BF
MNEGSIGGDGGGRASEKWPSERAPTCELCPHDDLGGLDDARATEAATRGEISLGRLVREHNPEGCRLIGFTTYMGTVTAADDWDGPAERKQVRPELPGSIEELFRETGHKEFLLDFVHSYRAAEALRSARLERAIGVIYRPRTELRSHYFRTRLKGQPAGGAE